MIIYDWNGKEPQDESPRPKVQTFDETLRDGLQSPSVVWPSLGDKIKILRTMDRLGITSADLGLPSFNGRGYDETKK